MKTLISLPQFHDVCPRRWAGLAGWMVGVGLGITAGSGLVRAAAADSLEARFAALERQVEVLTVENRALREIVTVGSDKNASVLVRPEGKETKISLGGLMQVQGESGGAPDVRYAGIKDRFMLRRMRVAVGGAFAENMLFKFESDFGNGAVAGKTGASGQITDAVVTWNRYPGFNLKGGQFKTPFGFEQLIADPKTSFVERSLTNDRLTVGRQIGVGACGEIFGPALGYSVGLFNGSGTNIGSNDNGKYMTAGRLTSTIYSATRDSHSVRWNVGTNFFNTVDQGTFTGRRTGYGLDSQFTWGPAMVAAEWLRNDCHAVVGRPVASDGWYLYSGWTFNRWLQGVVRYEIYDANLALANVTTREWTVGFNYFIRGDDLKLAVNYQLGEQPAPLPRAGRLLGRMQLAF